MHITYVKFIFHREQFYSFKIADIVPLIIKKINLINLHVVTEKSILVDVTNILNILLTEMTWAFLAELL